MEIEVGEYIRTKNGDIRKITHICEGKEKTVFGKYGLDKPQNNCYSIAEKKIVKHSKNIIDLIEVGDILEIKTGLYSGFMEFIETDEDLEILSKQIEEYWHIKSILTHERYEAECYEVEE